MPSSDGNGGVGFGGDVARDLVARIDRDLVCIAPHRLAGLARGARGSTIATVTTRARKKAMPSRS